MIINESNNTNEVTLNGEVFVKKSSLIPEQSGEAVVVRTKTAGTFFGYMDKDKSSLKDEIVVLRRARNLWSWSGANTASCIAMFGVKNPEECRFTAEHDITLVGVHAVIGATAAAVASINKVSPWIA